MSKSYPTVFLLLAAGDSVAAGLPRPRPAPFLAGGELPGGGLERRELPLVAGDGISLSELWLRARTPRPRPRPADFLLAVALESLYGIECNIIALSK